jgi:L-alanine-DL-glutamate epimerase-like enolase superfamily enzyme
MSASWNGVSFSASLEPYPLILRTTFGTSHSATNERLNGLITVKVGNESGYGECAMPPKKPGIYLADYEDCVKCFEVVSQGFLKLEEKRDFEPFAKVTEQYFAKGRVVDEGNKELEVVRAMFGVVDEQEGVKEFRVCRNGLEMALLDLWGKLAHIGTAELILGDQWNVKRPTYYTVGMNSDLEEMKSSARFGLQHTPYLKLKMDKNVSFWSSWLPQLFETCHSLVKEKKDKLNSISSNPSSDPSHHPSEPFNALLNGSSFPFVWSIDANADWSPEVAFQMLPILLPYKHIISMVEQPFGAHLKEEEIKAWEAVKEVYGKEGLVIYADESVSTASDIDRLLPISHGVNIKLDKTGGVREALRAREEAVKAGLGVWIGIMVSSSLSTSMASCILPLSTLGGDLDGQLLVLPNSDQFQGGLNWDTATGLCSPPSLSHGLGLSKKQI